MNDEQKRKNEDFYALVRKMREAQRDYFACSCPSSLHRAKRLEKLVDESVREFEIASGPQQAQLI